MNTSIDRANPLPSSVLASLEARLTLSRLPAASPRPVLEDRDIDAARAVTPPNGHLPPLSLIKDLKLLLAALGAGNSVVPLGDNSRTTRRLSEYAHSLCVN